MRSWKNQLKRRKKFRKIRYWKTEHEEHTVIDNPVINAPRHLNLFECGKNILNKPDATREWEWTETTRDEYYTKMCKTLTDYNVWRNIPLSDKNIQEAIHIFI